MKRIGIVALVAVAAIGSAFSAGGALASPGQGEGHTPVLVCHWVPAHGGSFISIVVDDDGADGNKNEQAHDGHELDVINPEDGVCPSGDTD